MAGIAVRAGVAADLRDVARIQAQSPEAAQWDPHDYLRHDCAVALCDDRVAGFVVARRVAEDETEILNLAVDRSLRRRGIGRALLYRVLSGHRGTLFLEVRESNQAARSLYNALGFQQVAVRPGYYDAPRESAIVMKFHSC
jgi:[ribosomal protein S18]-alanine N-acetyltransferase